MEMNFYYFISKVNSPFQQTFWVDQSQSCDGRPLGAEVEDTVAAQSRSINRRITTKELL